MARWRLDHREVTWRASGGNSSGRRKARLSRSMDLTSYDLEFEHVPTGLVVKGRVHQGHYSRDQMRELRAKLCARLLDELEDIVARKLRIPGR
jgi:hypothetical protein